LEHLKNVRLERKYNRQIASKTNAKFKKKPTTKMFWSIPVAKPAIPIFNNNYEFRTQSWGTRPSTSLATWETSMPGSPWPVEMGPVLVISIRPERMNNFATRMGPWMIHMRRFPATDGRQINTKQWASSGKVVQRGMTAGRMGCYDSHVRIWEAIASSPHEVVTVLEDDVDWSYSAGVSILSKMKECFKEIKNVKWDFLSWGHGPWAFGKNQLSGLQNWRKPGTCQGFFAYTLTRDFAKCLIQHCKPYKASAVDKWFFDSFIQTQQFTVLCCEPRLCWVVDIVSDTEKKTTQFR
jgi:GR25 family glycosyltransferase involved in LPS biosynthesis